MAGETTQTFAPAMKEHYGAPTRPKKKSTILGTMIRKFGARQP